MLPQHVLDSALDTVRREFDAACIEASAKAKADLLQALNQVFRRFRSYENESDWVQTMVDAASAFAAEVAVFSIENGVAHLRGQAPNERLPATLSFPIASAAAFASASELKDPVTALRTAGEVGSALSEGHVSERAHLFPILNGTRVSAMLFASEAEADMNALELISGIAASVLERKANAALHAQISPAAPAKPSHTPQAGKMAAWSDLPPDQRQVHLRAQRFARVAIAEIQLARPEACRAGREQGDVYLFLKREIDKARQNYRKQFMTVSSMVDYLHLELVQVAAEGDERKLGVDYPGRLL